MKKYAYLIMAHSDFYILEKLLTLLDDERNDIFLHVDVKVREFNFDFYKNLVKKSKIYFIKRYDVRWGDYSQIQCELSLLKESINKDDYSYFHLLSGVDLPLKSQNYIHNFFDSYEDKDIQFIHYCTDDFSKSVEQRALYYHFIRNIKSPNKLLRTFSKGIEQICFFIQKACHFKRKLPPNFILKCGANWFSITKNLVLFLLKKEDEIYSLFNHSSCCDELFIQSFVFNSEFKNKLYYSKRDANYQANMRLIDWERGSPYTFTENDYNELISTDRLFARKFSSYQDKKIIDKIYNYLLN